MEAWKHFSGSGLKNCDIQKFANADWKVQSMDEKRELVRKHVRQIKAKGPKKTRSLFDCGFAKKASRTNVSDEVIDLAASNEAAVNDSERVQRHQWITTSGRGAVYDWALLDKNSR